MLILPSIPTHTTLITIYSTILSDKLGKFVPEDVTPAALAAGLPSSSLTDLYTNLSAGTPAKTPEINAKIIAAVSAAVSKAASYVFQYVWYAVIAFAVMAVVAACLTIDHGEYLTDEIARKMHGATVDVKSGSMETMTRLRILGVRRVAWRIETRRGRGRLRFEDA